MRKGDSFIVTDNEGEYQLIDRSVLDSFALKADIDPSDGSKQIKEDAWAYSEYILEPKYDPGKLIDVLDMNSFHENCVDVVARDSSGLNFTFVPSDKENEEDFDRQDILSFFDNISPSINTLLYRRMYDRRAIGYGALEIIREDRSESQIVNIAHIPAQTLRRHADGIRVKQMVGTKIVWFYIYGKNFNDKGEKVDIHADTGEFYPYNSLSAEEKANELLWSMDYAPGTNYYGRPKIMGALSAILGETSRERFNISFFKNYGMPAFAVTVTGDFADYELDPEDEGYDYTKTLKYRISQQLKQVIKNPHSAVTILVPSEGEEGNVEVKLQPLSVEQKEASFRLFRKDNRDEIIQAHKVDPSRLGIHEQGQLNGSNSKILDNSYKISTIAPLKTENEDDINNLLLNEFGLSDWKFTINDLDPKDYSLEIQVIKDLFNMGCITPNQIISAMGDRFGLIKSNNPYLDEYFVNGAPIERLFQRDTNFEENDILNTLENDLMGDALIYDEQYRKEEQVDIDGFEGKKSQKGDSTIKERIQKAFRDRNPFI